MEEDPYAQLKDRALESHFKRVKIPKKEEPKCMKERRQRRYEAMLRAIHADGEEVARRAFTPEEDALILKKPADVTWRTYAMMLFHGRFSENAVIARHRTLRSGGGKSRARKWSAIEDEKLLRGERPEGRDETACRYRMQRLKKIVIL
jgi:predicted transcriptional regulator